MKYKPQSALAALIVAMLLPSIAAAQLQWFGYAGGGDSAMLDRTAPYINFGYFITDGSPTNTAATSAVNRIVGRDMKVLVELGQLLWAPGTNSTYRSLHPDFRNRWNTWKSYNPTIFSSEKILAFLVRDEPFQNRVNIDQYELAAQMVKQDFPWAKIILIEAAVAVKTPCKVPISCWLTPTQVVRLLASASGRTPTGPSSDDIYSRAGRSFTVLPARSVCGFISD